MKIEWTAAALSDREAIFDYIEPEDPIAAVTVDDRIEASTARLSDFPESGRPGRVEGTRELIAARTPYVLPYRIAGDTVRILRVLHGARRWPESFPDDA